MSAKSIKPKPPESLGDAGATLWREVVGKWTLRADELRPLGGACAASGMLADFTRAWQDLGRPYVSKGSMGQEVEHPLIGSIDKQRKARQAFLRQLKLPDTPDTSVGANPARAAAASRWKHGA